MSDDHLDDMGEAEAADRYYAHRDEADTVGEEVAYVPPRGARIALRLSFDDERHIRQAAERAGITVSAFVRQAALQAAGKEAVDIERLRRELEQARAHLDDARDALG
jgi:uncharacterized protein (DUF1778 family)